MSGDANEPPSEYQLIGPAEDGKRCFRTTFREGLRSVRLPTLY